MDKRVFPETIECTVTYEGKPVAGLMLVAMLAVEAKNPYYVLFGPTGADGRALLEYPAIKEKADQTLELALMDYHPLEAVFTGVVEVSVFTTEDVDRALKAYEMFKSVAKYPAHYTDDLRQARQVLDGLGDPGRLRLSGTVKPEAIKLVIRQ